MQPEAGAAPIRDVGRPAERFRAARHRGLFSFVNNQRLVETLFSATRCSGPGALNGVSRNITLGLSHGPTPSPRQEGALVRQTPIDSQTNATVGAIEQGIRVPCAIKQGSEFPVRPRPGGSGGSQQTFGSADVPSLSLARARSLSQ